MTQPERDAQACGAARTIASAMLRPLADEVDQAERYPQAQLDALAAAGLLGVAIPERYGGLDLSPEAQVQVFAELASGCLVTTLVLSQHHGCTTLVAASPNAALRERWLPHLATGEAQGSNGFNFLNMPVERAPMRVTQVDGGYLLDGMLPWVTAAAQSDVLAAGAVFADGRQLLLALPLKAALARADGSISIDPPMQLAALTAAQTTVIRCQQYFVPQEEVLHGPGSQLLATIARGSHGFVPTAVTLGHARGSLVYLDEAARRSGGVAIEMADWVRGEGDQLEHDVRQALQQGAYDQSPRLRGRGNVLAARAAHFVLIAGGGTGFRRDKTPQRLYREAGFFSVWSASGMIIPQTLEHLTNPL